MIKFMPFFIIILMCVTVFGQSLENEYSLRDTVVVIADRYEISLKHETNTRTLFNQSIISNYSNHSALQVLDLFMPSSFVQEKKIMGYGVGSDGGGSIQLRGLGGKPNTGVLVLINGHPDFMGIFGHSLPDVYGMNDIESVEVLSGPSSTVFGSNAMGGVINLKLRNDYSRLLNVNFQVGSYGTYSMGLKFAKKLGETGFAFSYNKEGSQGHIDQTNFQSSQFNGHIEHKINNIWNLSTNFRYVPYSFDDPARTDDPNNFGTYGRIYRGMGDMILYNNGEVLKGSTQIYVNAGEHEFYDGFHSKDFSYGASVYQQYLLNSDLSLAMGGDLIQYGGKQIDVSENYDFTTYGIYGLAMYSPLQNLNMKMGFRYQHHSLGIDNVSPTAGISYSPVYSLRFFANYQTGFRIPTIRDLYLLPVSNANLSEEKVNSIEAGLEYFISYNASLKLSFYRNDVEGIILPVYNPVPPPPLKFQNSVDAIQKGFETTFNYAMNSFTNIQLSYSFLEPGELTAFNPKHQIKYLLSFRFDNFESSIYGKYIDQLFTDNFSRASVPDYFLLNINAAYNFKYFVLSLKMQNVLDKQYFYLPGYSAPGRYLIIGMNFSI